MLLHTISVGKRLHVTFLLLCLTLGYCHGWFFRRNEYECEKKRSPGDKPFYYGTTNLFCMTYSYYFNRFKRSPSRFTLVPIHSWIYYDGHYIEFGVYRNSTRPYDFAISTDFPKDGDKCGNKMKNTPMGYSSVGIDCIRGCGENYVQKYGEYRLLKNNCHVFVNRISKILCNFETCPQWCLS